ncbi:RNA polymerase sigma factor [Ilumatobacter sp.]|uniref:RNA polymerase sigma factor n=1 Tax=Ilumatobacter sp. TaxID=1967498 RepID=UPI003AF6C351
MGTTFEALVEQVEPDLRRALTGHIERSAVEDAVAEALAYAWENRERVLEMENPTGYLYRVAQSRARRRREGLIVWAGDREMPEVEPGLPDALASLPATQSSAVWLVHGCGWSYAMAADALDMSVSAVGTHLSRGMERLRHELGVTVND